MKKVHNNCSRAELFEDFKESLKDLSANEIKDVMNYVLTLKAQHTLSPSANLHQTNQKQQ